MLLDKIHKDAHVHAAGLDHLGENEALRGNVVKTQAGQKRGGSSLAQTKTVTYLLDISKGRLHDGSGLPRAVEEEGTKRRRRMARGDSKSFARRKSD
jgi:hypothetical protein